jgi:hypothetical protein
MFLERVAFARRDDTNDHSTLKASINLAGDIKEIKFQPHDMKKDDVDAGMVVLNGRYFDIELMYEWQNKFSYSASLTPSGVLWPKIEGMSINPAFLNNCGNDKVTNTRMSTYKIELHTSFKLGACLRYLSKSIAKEIMWLNKMVETFNEFDINMYVANLEKIARYKKVV